MKTNVAAIVLAAGLSKRMGKPKMLLQWGDTTVIGHVVNVLMRAGVENIIVVTGGARQSVEQILDPYRVTCVFNPRYKEDEMIYSLKVGLDTVPGSTGAAIIVLGDQPQMQVSVVEALLSAYSEEGAELIIPSYRMQRGHPWIVSRSLWPGIMKLSPPGTMKEFINEYTEKIHFVTVETDTILSDLDTPKDYEQQKP